MQDLEDFLKIGADFFQMLMNSSGQVRAPRGIIKGGWRMEDRRRLFSCEGGVVIDSRPLFYLRETARC